MRHASAFSKSQPRHRLGRPTKVYAGGVAEAAGADIVVFCLGVRQAGSGRASGGIQTWRAMRELVLPLSQNCPNAVFVVASNPVDALTTLFGRASGFPPERVIGTGTLLDTVALRVMLSE
ncbi:MAG: L-lactate dehydrogenase [Phycisphaerales bacterium]|nr:L-lactate dehydrogenase [Phycisphaerales bacterium]